MKMHGCLASENLPIRLSVVYIVKNGAGYLHKSLASVDDLADEVLVIDSGSKDDTVAIATYLGARVITHPWQGFGAQRQFAVDSATYDVILMLDADEILREEGMRAIRNALPKVLLGVAFGVNRYNHIADRPIRYGDWSRDTVVRLFHRQHGCFHASDVVHEHWYPTGPVETLPGYIVDHYPFLSYVDMLKKLQTYAELNAQKLAARGKPVASHAPMSHALAAFLRTYVLRLGFLDGVDGAAIAWTTALGSFMKYAIAREMQQAQTTPARK